MDSDVVRQAVTLDPAWAAELRRQWSALMEAAVWSDVKSSRMGAATRMRKRLLEVGEKLRSLAAARDWIPHPREQVKNALGSAFSLKDALTQFERAAQDMDGGAEVAQFARAVAALHTTLLSPLAELENRWAALLDSQYLDEDADD
jgi:hypothetical protein